MDSSGNDGILPHFWQLQTDAIQKLANGSSASVVRSAVAGTPGPPTVHKRVLTLPCEDFEYEGEPPGDEHRVARETARWIALQLLDQAHEPIARTSQDEAVSAVQLDLHAAIRQNEFSRGVPASIVYLTADISGGASTLAQVCASLQHARCDSRRSGPAVHIVAQGLGVRKFHSSLI